MSALGRWFRQHEHCNQLAAVFRALFSNSEVNCAHFIRQLGRHKGRQYDSTAFYNQIRNATSTNITRFDSALINLADYCTSNATILTSSEVAAMFVSLSI